MPWFRGENAPNPRLTRQIVRELLTDEQHGSVAWDLPVQDAPYFVIDIETSGFSPQTDIVLSIASATLRLPNLDLDCEGTPNTHLAPEPQTIPEPELWQNLEYALIGLRDTSIVPSCIWQLTGLTPESLVQGRDWREVLLETLKRAGGAVWVAHHARHELSFLQNSARDFWRLRLHPIVIDTALVAQALVGHPQIPTLDEVCTWLDVPIGKRHQADEDVRMTALVWQKEAKLCQALGLSTVGQVIEWARARAEG
ncbi:exonuclease domain-containing protein [Alicyclobacillus mengziensis]|uniref:DNA polymerase III subunit epsilon n=1 Tax=Alicyclobacillus mengziensis TaxID=2931921 RepID=A0A9X7VX28_9BACL|nr:exonuclease domain-containing protein [Alicyclobacillus mengziensis]QSO46170.1 DNA polymerase III subunit epsilon [Alicyclobacillus mengziensis]